jgi:protease I
MAVVIGCGGGKPEPVKTQPKKSVLFVIAPENFQDQEFQVPYELLKQAGHRVAVASRDTILATGMMGLKVKPDLPLSEVDTLDYDGLILVGGTGSVVYWDDPLLHQVVRHFVKADKVVAAICLAPVVLARAGVLEGLEATCFETAAGELTRSGANYTGRDLTVSGRIITGSGPQAAPAFARAIAEKLQE